MLLTSLIFLDERRSALVARAVPEVRMGSRKEKKYVVFLGKIFCSYSAALDKYILRGDWRHSKPPHATKFRVGDENSKSFGLWPMKPNEKAA